MPTYGMTLAESCETREPARKFATRADDLTCTATPISSAKVVEQESVEKAPDVRATLDVRLGSARRKIAAHYYLLDPQP